MTHHVSLRPFCLALLPLLAPAALANEVLEPMTVTGTRTPVDLSRAPLIVNIIDRDDAVLATAARVEDVLSRQPGLHVGGQGRRNGQTLSMRGFDRQGVLVRLDGVRQDIATGHVGNFFLDPALIKEVQIARGALSSLYGSNAMGGVVSFDSVDADDLLRPGENSGARLSVGGASASNEWRTNVAAFGRRDTDRGALDGLISFGRSESGDIRRAGGDEAPDDAALNSLLLKGGWEPSREQRLFVSWQHYDERATQPANPQQRAVSTSNALRERDVTSDNVQLGHRWQPGPGTDVTSRLTFSQQDIEDDRATRRLDRVGLQSDGYHQMEHGWLSQTLAFGGELEKTRQRPSQHANGFPRADIETQAAYLDTTLSAGAYVDEGGAGAFDLGLGARFDRYDASGQNGEDSVHDRVSPRLRVAWRPVDGLMFFSGYAEAFRAPSLSELYADERHFAGFCAGPAFCTPDNYWMPNPSLSPETSHTWESGLVWQRGDWQLRASYFDTRADDFIDTQVDIMAGTTQAVNVQRAALWGFDTRIAWQPSALPSVTGFAGLSEVSGKDRDSGEALGSQTPLEASLGGEVALFDPALRLGAQGRFARAFDKQDAAARLPGYALFDAHLAWQLTPKVDTSLRLANLGDKVWYRPDGSLGDGRSLLATLNWQW
ncbi:TonB-dependent receptor domain-containing protein [Vreelandella sp. EE7]